MPRIEPLTPPYDPAVEQRLGKMMPDGVPPILLFRTFAKNLPMTDALAGWGGYELSNRLSLSIRDREILINRTCARCDCEYEWGVHVVFFADAAGLSRDQIASLTHGDRSDRCWNEARDQLLIAAADSLHDRSGFDETLDAELTNTFSEPEMLDIMMLCGWYHAISFTANGAKVDLEEGAPRFADYSPAVPGYC